MNGRCAALPSLWLCILALSWASHTSGVEPPLPPKPTTYFSDQAGAVSAEVAGSLNQRLDAFERETSNQLVVAVYPKLPDGAELNDHVFRVFQAWGIGQKDRKNGVLLMVFVNDRKMRIEVGYGLEGRLPDMVCASIIRDIIAPQFKTGAYGQGLERGVDAIMRAARGEYQGTGRTNADRSSPGIPIPGWVIVLLLIMILIWIHTGDMMIQRVGRTIFWNVLNVAFSGGGGRSSGSGGGGGFSGGGGSSGGGGASGSW